MGVHGLTTYLRENQRVLSKPLVLAATKSDQPVPLVVDGWSFIYELYGQSHLPWAYGGQYSAFHDLVVKVAKAWIEVGFVPHFVFDGPYPALKFPTGVLRVTQSTIKPSLLFFRTSTASRATPRFMRENAILPPFCYATTLQALHALGSSVKVYFADEEGDPFAVALAGRLGGYVTGHDSDFVILNAEGYAGYIPMDQMVWTSSAQDKAAPQDDGGFVAARRPKARETNSQSGQGLIPPDTVEPLSLTCIVFSPYTLAAHFRISMSLLPLFAGLAGNDFTADRRPVHTLFFDHGMSVSQRISRVASALQSVAAIASGSSKRKVKHPITSVVDFIDATVETLLVKPSSTMGSGEREAIVEKTVQATLQYGIPKHKSDSDLDPSTCALHSPATCPLVEYLSIPMSVDGEEPPHRDRVRSLYITAYRQGQLSPRIMDMLSTGTAWPKLFLEDPDVETVARTIGRPLREWLYSVLEDGIGLPELSQEDAEEGEEVQEDDEDELIDVVEEDSEEEDEDGGLGYADPLAPLQGALQELHTGVKQPPPTSSYASSSQNLPPKVIIEYLRRGARCVGEEVTVPRLARLLSSLGQVPEFLPDDEYIPVQLMEEERRFDLFLRILGSNTPAIRKLPPSRLAAVLSLRWVLRRLRDRAAEVGSSQEREKEKWTQNEGKAFLASFASDEPNPSALPLLLNRNIQLVAQASAALEVVIMLSQALLLADRAPNPAHIFSGSMFHGFLTGERKYDENVLVGAWGDYVDGLVDAFGMERGKKGKKERKLAVNNGQAGGGGPSRQKSSKFGLLASMDDA